MFPGPTLPYGMVKIGPDLYTGTDSYSGYQPTGNLTGFSLLHESGTGGAPKYGVVAQMPWQGNLTNPLEYLNATRLQDDYAEVGYYRAVLGPVGGATTVELAAAARAGMLRYSFLNEAEAPTEKHVVVDVSHTLFSYRGQGLGQNYLGGHMTVQEEGDGVVRYYGSGSYDNGWSVLFMTLVCVRVTSDGQAGIVRQNGQSTSAAHSTPPPPGAPLSASTTPRPRYSRTTRPRPSRPTPSDSALCSPSTRRK